MGIHWTFSPMCDVSRDPRWGRVSEGAGEDPYLGARVAEAMVRGYQGDLSDPSSVLACVKHFAAYGAPQAGREYHAVDMSERVFRDSYLPPYRAALDAGAATVMTSFNDLDGVPATANRWLMRDLLRDELGFGGFVVTDYGTIGELKAHGVAGDDAQAAELALRAGVNMDMMSAAYLFHAAELVREGRIPESLIDSLCREVLAVKFRLGLFDDPFRYQAKEREKCYYAPEHLDAARRVARSSMVLLENRGGVLPLKKGSRLALVGPFRRGRPDLDLSRRTAGAFRSRPCDLCPRMRPAQGPRRRYFGGGGRSREVGRGAGCARIEGGGERRGGKPCVACAARRAA